MFWSYEFLGWGVSVELEGISREADIRVGLRFDCEEGMIFFCVECSSFGTEINGPKPGGNGGLGSLDKVMGSVCGLVIWA